MQTSGFKAQAIKAENQSETTHPTLTGQAAAGEKGPRPHLDTVGVPSFADGISITHTSSADSVPSRLVRGPGGDHQP